MRVFFYYIVKLQNYEIILSLFKMNQKKISRQKKTVDSQRFFFCDIIV